MPEADISQELKAELKKGNIKAFEQALFLYEKRIYNYVYGLVGKREDAEDVAQEVFIKLYKNLKNIDFDKNFKSWLYKIATNTAYDHLRAKKKEAGNIPWLDYSSIETKEENLPYYELKDSIDINLALDRIKPAYKSILLLYYYDELSYQEIAEALSMPINTVKTHLFRAKSELKEKIDHQ